MNIDELKESKYLKRSDVVGVNGQGLLVTIDRCETVNVAKEGQAPEMKRVIWFKELDRPLVGNSTNREIIAQITGQRDDDYWEGHKVVLYDDPSISFGGKLVGGIRVRKPRLAPSKPAPVAPRPRPDDPKPIGQFMPPIVPTTERAVEAGEDIDPENPY